MPIANGFLHREDFENEACFELNVGFCESCLMMQLTEPVFREKMFHDQYPFSTSSSAFMSAHFRRFAAQVIEGSAADKRAFIVEIGSNDGTMLEPFAAAGVRHLGIDPSRNVVTAAEAKGVKTACRFFDQQLAREIVLEHGQASAILAANCFCHIQDLHSLAEGIQTLLQPQGLLIFEDPYLGDIIRLNSYDQIYDEHVYYFSLAAVANWLAPYGLEVIDAQPQAVHGGSMRYSVARRGAFRVGAGVMAVRDGELRADLHRPETYAHFRRRIEYSRNDLLALLSQLRRDDKRVVGYGATSKSTTVLNYCNITPDLIEFITDTTPLKQGKFSPGAHIPIRPHADFKADYPDYALLFAWNHAEEIMAKEREFRAAGGRWIRYVPQITLA